MGIIFTLILWATFSILAAVLGSAVLTGLTAFLTRHRPHRYFLILFSALLPFLCLTWGGVVFVFQGAVNGVFLERDIGIGDEFYCPIPNGYSILMIDLMDHATLIPKQKDFPSFAEVVSLQIENQIILGKTEQQWPLYQKRKIEYFYINTESGDFKIFSDIYQMKIFLEQKIKVDLATVASIYSKYRYTWFDYACLLLVITPITVGIFILGLGIFHVRSL